jgi:PAS domain S-box-containing protein
MIGLVAVMLAALIALALLISSGWSNRNQAYRSANTLAHIDALEDALMQLSISVADGAAGDESSLTDHLEDIEELLQIVENQEVAGLQEVTDQIGRLMLVIKSEYRPQAGDPAERPRLLEGIARVRKQVHNAADQLRSQSIESLTKGKQDAYLALIAAVIGALVGIIGGLLFVFQQRALAQARMTGDLSELMMAAATCTDEGILISDIGSGSREACIVFANRSFSRMTGIRVDELVGQPASDLLQRLFSEQERACLEESMTASRSTRLETTTLRKDGSGFPAEWHLSPIWDDQGHLTHFVSTLRDASERKAQEAQLIQSEKMAAIGQLAAGIMHEVINPVALAMSELRTLTTDMAVLRKYFRLLRSLKEAVESEKGTKRLLNQINALATKHDLDGLVDETEEMLEAANDGLERARDIAGDLKGYARPSEVEPEVTDINGLIDSALKLTRGAIKSKCMVVRELSDVPQIRSRPDQIFQVLTNLLINAAQAIPDSGEITVESLVVGSEVLVKVSDTGVGISPENQKRLFTPFFTTKPKGEGTGLGLSVSYDIIERLGGSIGVESAVGVGTTFTIRLPIDWGG